LYACFGLEDISFDTDISRTGGPLTIIDGQTVTGGYRVETREDENGKQVYIVMRWSLLHRFLQQRNISGGLYRIPGTSPQI
jgi:hypothetical protein